ncbi:hypothetical protein DU38_05200 [Methanosarcina mazei]|uniref:Uncharacterized protein n=1 Tax=Methanosarcina mazei TaxID=2209 RepID=A0A0F8H461_METMZ|nr:hypothetical protein DU49_04230 [Methanosarcina mazei]KKG38802.1 hypothetical protein DU35_11445 [Methanosarcina mazei]KKG39395.1 hypothetical protein DU41_16185 [Methanosarcina mazei]KKG46984.1 hypothetical protein DU39_05055 [Methanosarcina mazei]KKG47790.1 hypothetical protein DU38_05200 [Methanosarcina mazei]
MDEIFHDENTKYELKLFNQVDIDWLEERIFDKGGKPYLKCLGSEKERPVKPEEIVRQLWLKKIIFEFHYPIDRILVEKSVWFGSGVSDKAADIVITHKDSESPYIIFEVKKPKRKDGIQQLKSYCNAEGSPIGVWSNGGEKVILHREEPNIFQNIDEIPTVDQTLQDVIGQLWTIDKLKDENRLIKEKLSLKDIILDLENLVLANAKGIDDSFDEVFKLIYSKLYDEWAAVNLPQRNRKIQFRIYGESASELYEKINSLFREASKKWKGVFTKTDKINLTPNHLWVCVSFLQGIRLYNANLQVIDEAFEYLVTEIAKGKKGQYFTPRWVIDMCVKMLNPKIDEKMIDPACGSAGFTVHTIFWVAGEQFTAEGLPSHIVEYARNNVFGIDSSPRAVKIAKAINLIAGDGKTNIYELNSLEADKWDYIGRAGFKDMLTEFDDPELNDENDKLYKYFDFDLVLTNPPFAGNINERSILKNYYLAEKNGKTVSKIGRDILFIERCINSLRSGYGTKDDVDYVPGGRCAIILPQGRLNNSSDLRIRNFIFDRARILAVVGLHINTFKPHTGTKTSVLFFQKYTNEECKVIQEIINKHELEWHSFLEKVIKPLAENTSLVEDDLPDLLKNELENYFEKEQVSDEDEEGANVEQEELSEDDVRNEIYELEEELSSKPKKFKGKIDLIRKINNKKKILASFSLHSQIEYFVSDEKAIENFRKTWLAQKAAEDMDYRIFFAINKRAGKDNSGQPIYKKDENGQRELDAHQHLIIDHDCDEIAEEFKKFAQDEKQDFYFWRKNG